MPSAGIIRDTGIIGGRVLYEEIGYVCLLCSMKQTEVLPFIPIGTTVFLQPTEKCVRPQDCTGWDTGWHEKRPKHLCAQIGFFRGCQSSVSYDNSPHDSPDFFEDVSFHVSFHVKFGYMGCCDFSINNPQNTCMVTWLLTWNITFWVKYSVKKSGDWINTGKSRLNF